MKKLSFLLVTSFLLITVGCARHPYPPKIASEVKYTHLTKNIQASVTVLLPHRGHGSGVLVKSNRTGRIKYVVTAGHVVESLIHFDPVTNKAMFDDVIIERDLPLSDHGEQCGKYGINAKVICYSAKGLVGHDIAILRLANENVFTQSVEFESYNHKCLIGDDIYMVGSLVDENVLGQLFIPGHVGKTGIMLKHEGVSNYAFDTTLSGAGPGCSGCGVFSTNTGKYIGMQTGGLDHSELGYHIPIRRLIDFSRQANIEFIFDPNKQDPSDSEMDQRDVDQSDVKLTTVSMPPADVLPPFPPSDVSGIPIIPNDKAELIPIPPRLKDGK